MSSWISQILPPVWSTMTSSADKYVKNVVNDTGDEEEIVDSDGEILGKNLRIRGQLQKIYSHTDCSHLYFSILSILLGL